MTKQLEANPDDVMLQASVEQQAKLIGLAMLRGLEHLPADDGVTDDERRLVEALEAEVEQAFGPGAALHGRAVALYAVRDLAAGAPPRK